MNLVTDRTRGTITITWTSKTSVAIAALVRAIVHDIDKTTEGDVQVGLLVSSDDLTDLVNAVFTVGNTALDLLGAEYKPPSAEQYPLFTASFGADLVELPPVDENGAGAENDYNGDDVELPF